MKKKLIVNPKKNDITRDTQVLDFAKVFGTLMLKVYQSEEKDFKELITTEGHIRRFVGNVNPTRKTVQDYAGKKISSYEEASAYLKKIGTEIYGDSQWPFHLIINEVKFGRGQDFAMETESDELVKKITDGLDGVATVEYNKVKKPAVKKNNKSESVTETEAANSSNEQEN